MNDFTKDDLELIAECVEADFNQTNWPRCMYEPLKNKIQSMIETYNDKISYYRCGKCTEKVSFAMECPCCGFEGCEKEQLKTMIWGD